MAATLHDIASLALSLDPADRLRLATELIDSVDGPPDPGWTAAWAVEVRRRSEAADGRRSRGSSWRDVRSRLLRDLAEMGDEGPESPESDGE